MTEQEAAERLAMLLNEIQAAGHEVMPHEDGIRIGDLLIAEPRWVDAVWEVEAE